MTEPRIRKLPFKVVSSSVDSEYVTFLSNNFKSGIDIVNMHRDQYGDANITSIQSTFTNRLVGGEQSRRLPINLGSDNNFNRPELFKINATASSLRIYGPDFENVNYPRANYWTGPKSPINISNVQILDRVVGNFNKNYEIFQTSGRILNNNLIADGYTSSVSITPTQFIFGANNFTLPDLLTSSKSIIVERFNAPGDKKQSSRGALERAGEELSPNNSLTTRNIVVRQAYYNQLSQHSPQFGSGSTYAILPATGTVNAVSIHKVNRNGSRVIKLSGSSYISSSNYDNYWVQHAIPQDNFGFAWITASAVSNPYTLGDSSIQFDITSSLSTIKDKQIDLDTQTINGSIKNVDGYYSTLRQIRTGEHPVARKLRKNNLLSIQDTPAYVETNKISIRSGKSTNFKEPPVTSKYYPIKQKIRFEGEPEDEYTSLIYSYGNIASKFSNESINTKLNLKKSPVLFYEKIVDSKDIENSPILDISELNFKENIFPRAQNTYLSGTRSRTAYILDQAGFERDGYDRQLGTQRVFWRDNQEDRRRSANSTGGYINSLGYSSLEESGSDFIQYENGILFDNSLINHSASLKQNFINLEKGINNSIILLESASSERELFTYTGSFLGTFYNNGNIAYKVYADIVKRGTTQDIAGEFNNSFIDFYEQFTKNERKQSIGAIYRNTSYKQMINSLAKQREDLLDKISQTDDEELFVNPKPKYVAFVGGGELNTGSIFDNSNNFSNEYFNTYISGANNFVSSSLLINNKIYFAGNFTQIGGIAADSIAAYDKTTQKFSAISTSTISGSIKKISVSGTDLYIGGRFTIDDYGYLFAKYDTTINSISGVYLGYSYGPGDDIRSIVISGTNAYFGGRNSYYLKKYDTINKVITFISSSIVNDVYAMVLSGTDLYICGNFVTPSVGIAKYNTISNTWSALGTGLNNFGYSMVLSGTDLYVGGIFTSPGTRVAKWSTTTNTWSSVGAGTDGAVFSLLVSGTDIYAGGIFSSPGINIAKWSTLDSTWYNLSGGLNGQVSSLLYSGSDIYATGQFTVSGSRIAKWTNIDNKWSILNTSPSYNYFSKNILNNSLSYSDVYFSTLDNGIINIKNKSSSYDAAENYYKSDIYQVGKNYSVLSEFKISDHIKDYVLSGNNFQSQNNQIFILDGASPNYKSANSTTSLFNADFFEKYLYTDIFNKSDIERDYSVPEDTISINVSGIKKLLPYNGFYPQDRTLQIVNLYSDYIDNVLAGGIYNLNNINDYYNDRILSGNYSGTVTNYVDLNSNIDVERYNSKYFLLQNTIPRSYLYSSSASSYKDFSQTILYSYDNHFGSKLISASNGLNIYSFSSSAGITSSYNHVSTDGITWSTPSSVIQSISASDGFGQYWDYIYENNSILGEKILFSISSPYVTVGALSVAGAVSFISATMSQYSNGTKYWNYSDKVVIATGSAPGNRFGTGISMISCSTGYQLFMGELFGDTTSEDYGNIWVSTSSNGSSWSSPISIVSGTIISSSIGFNNIKAANFTKDGISKTYLFFTELYSYSSGSSNVVGKFFVISSSANNNWGTTNINPTRTELYVSTPSTTISGTLFDVSDTNKYSIEVFSNSSSLNYCFVNGIDDSEELYSEILIGTTYDGINWQTGDQMFRQINTGIRGCDLVAISTYEKEGNTFPVFFTNLSSSAGVNSIYAFHNNQFTQFSLNISGTEKYVKQAALEPVMGPGILYNTIKSGIAVDWPCATGSQTSIQPYGSGTIVNAYYPQSFKMASHQGNNIEELNIYGNLRSNVDYRVDFEKLIFPDDIFPVKNQLTSSLLEITTLSSLSENSEIVQFISGCYIYGGYEPYTSPVDFSDYNQLGPKRFSIPFVYRKENASDSGLYSMAMSNFLAETVKFFLKDGLLTSFQSKPDSQWGTFENGKKYYMDIIMFKSPNLVMIEAYHSEKHPTGSHNEKMNGRYFGYPVNKTNKKLWSLDSEQLFTEEEAKLIHNDPAYAPYTPPYFEGEAIARVSFSPTITRKYSIDEIFSQLVVEDIFPGVERSANTDSDAYVNKMPVESSLQIKGKLPWVDITKGQQNSTTTNNDINNWIISTKFETPVLNFSSQSLTPYENNYLKSSGYGRGMWSGYGQIPSGNAGIYVSLRESFPQVVNKRKNSKIQSLLQKVGFTQTSKKVGLLADQKVIKEAVMIIPFIEKTNITGFRTYAYSDQSKLTDIEKELNIEFIGVNKAIYNKIIKDNINSSINDTIFKMKEFIVPPKLDYVKDMTLDPYVAYIASFEHKLSQQDLADIWQGVSPKIATTAELDEKNISHPNSETEFFHGQGMPNDIRFMVFKIKQKGEFDYFKVTRDSTDDSTFERQIGRKIDDYSYNWPYDFYSLVELAKVDVEINYKKKKD